MARMAVSLSNNNQAEDQSKLHPKPSVTWVVSSATQRHATPTESVLENKRLLPAPVSMVYNGSIFSGSVIGDVTISSQLALKDVVYIPDLPEPVLSVGLLIKASRLNLICDSGGCKFLDSVTGKSVAVGRVDGGRCVLDPADQNCIGVTWVISSVAQRHATSTESVLENKRVLPAPVSMEFYGSIFTGSIIGDVTISSQLTLKDVVYMPDLKQSLLSVGLLTETLHLNLVCDGGGCKFIDSVTGKNVAVGRVDGGCFVLDPADQNCIGMTWVISSVAQRHVTSTESVLENKRMLPAPVSMEFYGSIYTGSIVGDVTISSQLTLKDVVYLPGLKESFLSVGLLTKTSYLKLICQNDECMFIDRRTGESIAVGRIDEGCFVLDPADQN